MMFIKNIDSKSTRNYWLFKTDDFNKNIKVKKSPLSSSTNYTSRHSFFLVQILFGQTKNL